MEDLLIELIHLFHTWAHLQGKLCSGLHHLTICIRIFMMFHLMQCHLALVTQMYLPEELPKIFINDRVQCTLNIHLYTWAINMIVMGSHYLQCTMKCLTLIRTLPHIMLMPINKVPLLHLVLQPCTVLISHRPKFCQFISLVTKINSSQGKNIQTDKAVVEMAA